MFDRSDSVTNHSYGYENQRLLEQLDFSEARKIIESPKVGKYVTEQDKEEFAINSAVLVKYINKKMTAIISGKNLTNIDIQDLYLEVLEEKERQEKENIQKEVENIQQEKAELQQVAESLQSNSQGRSK